MLKYQVVYCVQPFLGGKEVCCSWQNISNWRTQVNTSVVNNTGTDKRRDNAIWKVIQRANNIDKSLFVVFVVLHASSRLSPISLLKPPFPPECILIFSQHRSLSVSPSLALHSFVSGCLWSWANLLEAKCLYLGQLRIRSHVVSATPKPAWLPPRNCHSLSLSLSLPLLYPSLSTVTRQNGYKWRGQVSRWRRDKRQTVSHNAWCFHAIQINSLAEHQEDYTDLWMNCRLEFHYSPLARQTQNGSKKDGGWNRCRRATQREWKGKGNDRS